MLLSEMVKSEGGPGPQQCLLSGAGTGTDPAKPRRALPVEGHLFARSVHLQRQVWEVLVQSQRSPFSQKFQKFAFFKVTS